MDTHLYLHQLNNINNARLFTSHSFKFRLLFVEKVFAVIGRNTYFRLWKRNHLIYGERYLLYPFLLNYDMWDGPQSTYKKDEWYNHSLLLYFRLPFSIQYVLFNTWLKFCVIYYFTERLYIHKMSFYNSTNEIFKEFDLYAV